VFVDWDESIGYSQSSAGLATSEPARTARAVTRSCILPRRGAADIETLSENDGKPSHHGKTTHCASRFVRLVYFRRDWMVFRSKRRSDQLIDWPDQYAHF
jgi:hypothetical protein